MIRGRKDSEKHRERSQRHRTSVTASPRCIGDRVDAAGERHSADHRSGRSNEPLLYVLRNDLGLHGPKFGCGLGQCGACAVLVGGRPVRSCVTPTQAAAGRDVTTIEGLGSPAQPSPVQGAFIAEAAAQCGYCTAGMVVAASALLRENPHPTIQEIREALAGNLCRCGSHPRVIRAIMRAARAGR